MLDVEAVMTKLPFLTSKNIRDLSALRGLDRGLDQRTWGLIRYCGLHPML